MSCFNDPASIHFHVSRSLFRLRREGSIIVSRIGSNGNRKRLRSAIFFPVSEKLPPEKRLVSGSVRFELRARQPDGEDGALPRLALERHPAAVEDGDMLHDGEAETGAAVLAGAPLLDAVEALKDAAPALLRDADARIGHGDFDELLLGADGGGDAAAGLVVLHAVLHQVQQQFLKALAEKVLSTDTIMKNATTLIKTAYDYVKTDFTLTDMLKYVNYLDNVDPEGITMQTIPGVGQMLGDTSYYIYDEDLIGETVDMFLRGTTAEIEAQKAEAEKQAAIESGKNISSVGKNIMVANGGYKSGFAGQNQTMLEENGFTVQGVYTYNGEKTSYTRIVVSEEGMGYDLQEYYPNSQIIVDKTMMENGEDILIILGTDE